MFPVYVAHTLFTEDVKCPTHFTFQFRLSVASQAQHEEAEMEFLVYVACSRVHRFRLAPTVVAYFWGPNGTLPRAVSLW